MIRIAVLLCAFIALVKGQSTEVSHCTQNAGNLPIKTYIEGCTTPPCEFRQLEDAVINLEFEAPYSIRSMRTLATAYILFIGIPYDLQEKAETCNFLTNSQCPLSAGEVAQYTLRMYIEPFFPVGTSVTIEFRLVDENNAPFVCIRVPIRITAAATGAIGANNSTITTNV